MFCSNSFHKRELKSCHKICRMRLLKLRASWNFATSIFFLSSSRSIRTPIFGWFEVLLWFLKAYIFPVLTWKWWLFLGKSKFLMKIIGATGPHPICPREVPLSIGVPLRQQALLAEQSSRVLKNLISYFQHIFCFRMLHFYRFLMIGVNRGSENLCF